MNRRNFLAALIAPFVVGTVGASLIPREAPRIMCGVDVARLGHADVNMALLVERGRSWAPDYIQRLYSPYSADLMDLGRED